MDQIKLIAAAHWGEFLGWVLTILMTIHFTLQDFESFKSISLWGLSAAWGVFKVLNAIQKKKSDKLDNQKRELELEIMRFEHEQKKSIKQIQ